MPYRSLGSTGQYVSAIGVGGWHRGFRHIDERESIRIIRTAIDSGINFMDNSWDYNEARAKFGWERHCAIAIVKKYSS